MSETPDIKATLPDYRGGSLVNLMSSIATALGGSSPYPPLAALPPQALAGARHLVLLVVDGLGFDYLSSRDGALRRHLRGHLTSVFPSTTASAIPTFLTGLAPQQHGLTGWNMYFREIGAVVAPLPFRVRTGRHALREAGVTPADLLGLTPLFDRLPLPCHVVSPRNIIHSDFNIALSGRAKRHAYESVDELFALIGGLLRIDAPSYIHAYWPQLDSLAHEHGFQSEPVAAAFATLDAAFDFISPPEASGFTAGSSTTSKLAVVSWNQVALYPEGSEPDDLAHCARLGERRGYAEINLNCGCPSDRVHAGAFGACLMLRPEHTVGLVEAMRAAVHIPVTVKLRIGVVDATRDCEAVAAEILDLVRTWLR